MTTRVARFIPIITEELSTDQLIGSALVRNVMIDGALLPDNFCNAKIIGRFKKSGGGNGYLVVFDEECVEFRGLIAFDDVDYTIYEADLSAMPCPSEVLAFALYTDGSGWAFCDALTLVIV